MMRKFRTAVALAASLALAGCQTLDGVTVNGVDVNKDVKEAQGNLGNCGNVNCFLLAAGAVAIGVGLYFILHDDDDDGGSGY